MILFVYEDVTFLIYGGCYTYCILKRIRVTKLIAVSPSLHVIPVTAILNKGFGIGTHLTLQKMGRSKGHGLLKLMVLL